MSDIRAYSQWRYIYKSNVSYLIFGHFYLFQEIVAAQNFSQGWNRNYIRNTHNHLKCISIHLFYNSIRSCVCLCSQTPPSPFDGFTSFFCEKVLLIPGLQLIYNSWLWIKVTMPAVRKINQLWTTYSCDSSNWRSYQAEQLL